MTAIPELPEPPKPRMDVTGAWVHDDAELRAYGLSMYRKGLEDAARLPEVKALMDLAAGVDAQKNYQTVRVFIETALSKG